MSGTFTYGSRPNLLKFGNPVWLREALGLGKFRIAPASYYDSLIHNHARRDKELERILFPCPRDPRLQDFIRKIPEGKIISTLTIKAPSDYYLFSLCSSYTSRLFGDFGSTACLIIYEPDSFLKRFEEAIKKTLPTYSYRMGPVIYFDPVRIDPSLVDVPFWKPLRHAYQKELRLTLFPSAPINELESFKIEIGPLSDWAELVEL